MNVRNANGYHKLDSIHLFRVKCAECATPGESGQVKDCYGFLQAPEQAGARLDRTQGPALYGRVPKRTRARSSAGEHSLHTGGVAGSIPAVPTMENPRETLGFSLFEILNIP